MLIPEPSSSTSSNSGKSSGDDSQSDLPARASRGVILTNRQLHELLRPVLVLAGDDYSLPVLATVRVQRLGDHLYASATDRFRAGVKRIKLDEESSSEPFEALVPVESVKQLLALFKPSRVSVVRQPRLLLTLDDDGLTATTLRGEDAADRHEYRAMTVTVELFNRRTQYPDIYSLIRSVLGDDEPPAPAVGFNAKFLASFQEAVKWSGVVGGTAALVVRVHHNPTKPTTIAVEEDFVGILMPRTARGVPSIVPNLSSWTESLTALSPFPAVRA